MRYSFCPVCGQQLKRQSHDGQIVPTCQNGTCRFIFWQNSKPCVTAIITNSHGLLLMTIRGIEPEKDKLDLPGGFLHEGEHPYDGLKREMKEELGIEIDVVACLGFAVDRYGKDGDHTLNIGLIATVTKGTPKAADDAAALEWINPQTVDQKRLAFTNNAEFLKMWLGKGKHYGTRH